MTTGLPFVLPGINPSMQRRDFTILPAVAASILVLAACNNSNTVTEQKLDSMGRKFDSTAGRVWDSTKEKAKDLRDNIEKRLERKDSTDTTIKI